MSQHLHIHQLEFQVESVDRQPQPFLGYQDTVLVLERVNDVPGVVTIILPFLDGRIVGKFFYHCHMLLHEDYGMMAVIQVDPAETGTGGHRLDILIIGLAAGISAAIAVIAIIGAALWWRQRMRAAVAADGERHPILIASAAPAAECAHS